MPVRADAGAPRMAVMDLGDGSQWAIDVCWLRGRTSGDVVTLLRAAEQTVRTGWAVSAASRVSVPNDTTALGLPSRT